MGQEEGVEQAVHLKESLSVEADIIPGDMAEAFGVDVGELGCEFDAGIDPEFVDKVAGLDLAEFQGEDKLTDESLLVIGLVGAINRQLTILDQ